MKQDIFLSLMTFLTLLLTVIRNYSYSRLKLSICPVSLAENQRRCLHWFHHVNAELDIIAKHFSQQKPTKVDAIQLFLYC